jgi:ABC-type Fe3+-hydroxamate transport system substrate-binding protein
LGNEINIDFPPQRIVSLVPSITELLFDLGLGNRIVGKTKFCYYPATGLEDVMIVGGTKNYHLSKIKRLNPDLIIANKEENVEATISELQRLFPVWVSDVVGIEDALKLISSLGFITGTTQKAKDLSEEVGNSLNSIKDAFSGKVAYLIWNDPIMAAGQNTFINSILDHLGFENVIDQTRYPEISFKELVALHPEYIFLSSEPFPFKEKHINEFQSNLPSAKITLVNGEMFTWYGSRMLKFESYFKNLEIS